MIGAQLHASNDILDRQRRRPDAEREVGFRRCVDEHRGGHEVAVAEIVVDSRNAHRFVREVELDLVRDGMRILDGATLRLNDEAHVHVPAAAAAHQDALLLHGVDADRPCRRSRPYVTHLTVDRDRPPAHRAAEFLPDRSAGLAAFDVRPIVVPLRVRWRSGTQGERGNRETREVTHVMLRACGLGPYP